MKATSESHPRQEAWASPVRAPGKPSNWDVHVAPASSDARVNPEIGGARFKMIVILEKFCRSKPFCWAGDAELFGQYYGFNYHRSAGQELLRAMEKAGLITRVREKGRRGRLGILLHWRTDTKLPVVARNDEAIADATEQLKAAKEEHQTKLNGASNRDRQSPEMIPIYGERCARKTGHGQTGNPGAFCARISGFERRLSSSEEEEQESSSSKTGHDDDDSSREPGGGGKTTQAEVIEHASRLWPNALPGRPGTEAELLREDAGGIRREIVEAGRQAGRQVEDPWLLLVVGLCLAKAGLAVKNPLRFAVTCAKEAAKDGVIKAEGKAALNRFGRTSTAGPAPRAAPSEVVPRPTPEEIEQAKSDAALYGGDYADQRASHYARKRLNVWRDAGYLDAPRGGPA